MSEVLRIKQVKQCEKSPTEKHTFSKGNPSCDWCGMGAIIIGDQLLYVPTLKQNEYHKATAKNVLMVGGRGSGKSICGRWDAHMRAMAYPGFKYCILRRTYPELERSHLIDLPKEMRALGGEYNQTSKIARYPNGSTGYFAHCYDAETEVLTKRGFVLFDNLTEDDVVASLNLETNALVFQKPTARQKFYYAGEAIKVTGQGIDLLVTPDHPLLFWDKNTPIKMRADAGITCQRGRVPKRFRKTASWIGKDVSSYTLMPPMKIQGGRPAKCVNQVPMDEWLEFLGWFLSEGCTTSFIRASDNYQVQTTTISQKKYPWVVPRLSSILSNWGFTPHCTTHQKQLTENLVCFGKSHEKFVPSYVKDLSPRQINIFLEALFLGDGSFRNGQCYLYSTTSKRLADDVQELLLRLGKVGTVYAQPLRDGCKPSYIVVISQSRTEPCVDKSLFSSVPYQGYMYDVTMPEFPTLLVRRNGKTVWGHNCQNDADALNLLSSEFHLSFFDEVSTFDWEMFRKLAASVRMPLTFQEKYGIRALVRAATNPLGISADMINKYWVAKDVDPEEDPRYNPKEWVSIQANLEHNPYLPEDYLDQFSGMSAHTIKAWVHGEFSVENALFDFSPTKIKDGVRRPYHVIHDMDWDKVLRAATMYRSMDAGWFPDPTVCLWVAHLGNRHIVINEETWYKTEASRIADDIKRIDDQMGIKSVSITYCDPSMDINTTADIRTVKEIYEQKGIPMECSINDREMFATSIHQALAEQAGDGLPRIQFYSNPRGPAGRKGCPTLVRTIPMMRFHPKQFKKMDDHKADHWVVALAYYLMSHSADPRNEINFGRPLPKWMKPKLCRHGNPEGRCFTCRNYY
jgi:hypothetical protein